MKKKYYFIITLFWVITYIPFAYGQQIRISGQVTALEDNEPLPGVSIVLAGTTIGTTTDMNGMFSLSVPETNSVLRFSFIGYSTQEVTVGNQTVFNVKLDLELEQLDEIVVVGYCKQEKINITGSVGTVEGKELAAKPVSNVSMALQGTISGVTVTQGSGQPGKDSGTIRIRGIGTLGNSNPLVLIDGRQGDINSVDPSDIESISVLKDPASAAIYGSRAANGVILITTKRAKIGDIQINYNGYVGLQHITPIQFVDGYTYLVKNNEARTNAGLSPLYTQYLDDYKASNGLYSYDYPNVNFQDVIYNGSGLQQHHNLSISGGTEKLASYLSLSYLGQKGNSEGFTFKRYSLRLNNDYRVSEKLQFKLDFSSTKSPLRTPSNGNSAVVASIRMPSILGIYTPDKRYSTNYLNYGNPIATLNEGGSEETDNYILAGRFAMNLQPIHGMDIEIAYLPTYTFQYSNKFTKPVPLYQPGSQDPINYNQANPTLTEQFAKSVMNNMHALVKYNKRIAKHNIGILLGFEQIDSVTNNFSAYRRNFAFLNYPVMNNGDIENMSNSGAGSEWALRSYFGRLNYIFNEKYLFEANLRYDGSSRFTQKNRYGLFPSFSVGWRIAEEAFLKDIYWIQDLKLRGSWGQLGNQQIGNYPFASVIGTGSNYALGGAPVTGAALVDMANPNITWETSTTSDIGFDFTFFNRFSGSFDYYKRNTSDILLQLPIPQILGLNAPYQNAGKVENKGWDFSLYYSNQESSLKYKIGINLSDVKNEVVDLKGSGPYIKDVNITSEGDPIGALYMYESDGLYRSQNELDNAPIQFGTLALGDIRYKDQNGDNIIDAQDRVVVGSNIPRFSYGLNMNFEYKGIDVGFFFKG